MIDLTAPQRQSPVAMVFLGLRIVRNLGIAQVAVAIIFLTRASMSIALFLVPVVAVALLGAVSALAWWRYTFQLVDDELIVTKGVFRVDRLTVPTDRIQSISIDQELLHRITGLVKISVDTAGSAGAEFEIDAIPRPVAEELQRQAVTSAARPARTDAPAWPGADVEERIVLAHDARRLLRAAVTAWPLAGVIVLGPLFAFGQELRDWTPESVPDVEIEGFRWWWWPIATIAFIALSVLLNIVRVLLQDWDLTVRASSSGLRRTSGLLSRTSRASAIPRIQVVESTQNPLQRRAGIREVELATIGAGAISAIGCDDGQFDDLRRIAGVSDAERLRLDRRIDPAEVWLAVRNTTVAACLLAGIGGRFVGWWSLVVFVLVPMVWVARRRRVRNFRWTIGTELATFDNVIDVSTLQASLYKANAVRVTQSIFERRRGLGRVVLATAAGTVSVGMIPIEEARAVRDIVLLAAENDQRPWM